MFDPRLTNLLLVSSAVFHAHHLRALSHAEHTVLQAAYEAATEHADAILEQVMVLDPGTLDAFPIISTEPVGSHAGSPHAFLDYLIGQLTEANQAYAEHAGLQNVLQDAVSAFSRLKYQLSLTQE